MSEKRFLRTEAAGAVIIFLLASLLHFAYDLSGQSILVALFAAVNESIWEHIKIFDIAYLAFAVAEFLWARPPLKKFLVAKTAGVLVLTFALPLFFYGYTYFTGDSVVAVDILSGFVFTALAQLVSYKLTTTEKNTEKFFYTSVMVLFLLFMLLVSFSYFPPQAELFRDRVTGIYGVPAKGFDEGAVVLDVLSKK